jgi:hypothetical protein
MRPVWYIFWLDQTGEISLKAGLSQRIRERFSGLQTVWRWSQSPANPSLLHIPVNREIYRELWPLSSPGCVSRRVNTGVSDFWPAILTGTEQGNNRDNRENMPQNRLIDCGMQEQIFLTTLLPAAAWQQQLAPVPPTRNRH